MSSLEINIHKCAYYTQNYGKENKSFKSNNSHFELDTPRVTCFEIICMQNAKAWYTVFGRAAYDRYTVKLHCITNTSKIHIYTQ